MSFDDGPRPNRINVIRRELIIDIIEGYEECCFLSCEDVTAKNLRNQMRQIRVAYGC